MLSSVYRLPWHALLVMLFVLSGLAACGGGGGGGEEDGSDGDYSGSGSTVLDVSAGGPYSGLSGSTIQFAALVTGSSGTVSYTWDFGDGLGSAASNPAHVYAAAGQYPVTLTVTDGTGARASNATQAYIQDQAPASEVSINSTSQDSAGVVQVPVAERSPLAAGSYSVLAINDLGMHCGDYDTRVASILPPFQVLLSQVIRKGSTPELNPAGVELFYSAASNPNDPALLGSGDMNGLRADGSTYKTNYWGAVQRGAYDPFYPAQVTPLSTGVPGATEPVAPDVGLPVPNVEALYIGADGVVKSGDEQLVAAQHVMPGRDSPYAGNTPRRVEEFYGDKPFFVDFPFGYVAAGVNWYEGAGIPLAAFDDFGRENAYPLVRVEARSGNQVLATVDTVLPISGEASCSNCHADPADVQDSRSAAPSAALVRAGLPVATSLDDPEPDLPNKISVEYATDINILRLHDLRHGARYVDTDHNPQPCDIHANGGNGDASCLTSLALVQDSPVVCQVCHYTPALDLAQVGPMSGPQANGRNQLVHESNSRVIHSRHAEFTSLFPPMPAPAQDANGIVTNQAERLAVLDQTCYQCHPGKSTRCLRGAMFNADILCNDCHGDMAQVGADFSTGVSQDNPGPEGFQLGLGNFYDPGSAQPRVPWANEPGCGSCHTGDAGSNLAGSAGLLVNNRDTHGNVDGIRLRQAYRRGDAKATPIVPANRRFAEPAVPASYNGFANPGAGNPQLYRVSTGHGGVFCEGCHGATHAEWPNANPFANDNVTAEQLQGHSGTLVECSTCHGSAMDSRSTLGGPHGMHPVGENTSFARGGHERLAESNAGACAACHGPGSRSVNGGTVLSLAKADRILRGTLVRKGEPVGCSVCHGSGGGGD